MPVPPSSVLRAALRWLEYLPTSQLARTRALFTSHREFGDITPTQYHAAYTWLQAKGLLSASGSFGDPRTAIFSTAIEDTLWFADVDVLITEPAALPEDGIRAAEAMGLSLEEAFSSVRHMWAKVDTAERMRIGTAGELAVVELLSAIPAVEYRHLAAESDGYGYDIDVKALDANLHLEVKTTSKRGQLRMYLSRNEYERMRWDPAWSLVAVRLNLELHPVALATINRSWVEMAVPTDSRMGGRWESVRLDAPADALIPGLTGLPQELGSPLPRILEGEPHWPG